MKVAILTLSLALLCVLRVSGEVSGPVVGFVRVQIEAGPQKIRPTVQPFSLQTDDNEAQAQVLTAYLGDEFLSGTDASNSDWVGIADKDSGEVTIMWRDQQGQWRDLQGNSVEPNCDNVSELWVDLVFLEGEIQTRELVLSGQVVW